MSLRILFATHGPANLAMAVYRSVTEQAAHLRAEGHQVDVLTRDDLAASQSARLDPLVLPIRLMTRPLAHYDVIVFHSYMGWAFHLLRRVIDPGHRIATVTWFHGLEPLYHRAMVEQHRREGRTLSLRFRLLHHMLLPRLLRASTRASSGVFCLNQSEVAYLNSQGWSKRDQTYQVSNNVDPGCVMARQHRAVAHRLLFIGQWLPMKGVRYLVEAFTSLASRHDVELWCVGTGAPSDVVQDAFPSSLRPRVRVRPRVERAELHDHLRHADIFVLPSLSEGSSCALLEAMASQLPTVATPVGIAPELIDEGRNGVLVPCADAAAVTTSVERLITDVEMRERLGVAAGRAALRATSGACAEFSRSLLAVLARHRVADVQPAEVRGDAVY